MSAPIPANLLFEKNGQSSLSAFSPISARKLLDGVWDVLGWMQVGDKEKFVEINLIKLKPQFTKAFMSGYGLQNMELKVRNGQELTTQEIAEVRTEEFSVTYLLKRSAFPDALRMEFNTRRVNCMK